MVFGDWDDDGKLSFDEMIETELILNGTLNSKDGYTGDNILKERASGSSEGTPASDGKVAGCLKGCGCSVGILVALLVLLALIS